MVIGPRQSAVDSRYLRSTSGYKYLLSRRQVRCPFFASCCLKVSTQTDHRGCHIGSIYITAAASSLSWSSVTRSVNRFVPRPGLTCWEYAIKYIAFLTCHSNIKSGSICRSRKANSSQDIRGATGRKSAMGMDCFCTREHWHLMVCYIWSTSPLVSFVVTDAKINTDPCAWTVCTWPFQTTRIALNNAP